MRQDEVEFALNVPKNLQALYTQVRFYVQYQSGRNMKKFFALFFGVALWAYPVFGQSVRTQKAVYAPGESIVVEFSGFSGNKQDWISISQAGAADNSYITYTTRTSPRP